MPEAGVEEMATRLESAQSALMDALDGITDAELHTPPSEGEWTVAEICAHVIEMQPLWTGKAVSIGTASEVGRTAAEAERRKVEIEMHASDDAGTVRERLAAAGAEALGIFRDMGDAHRAGSHREVHHRPHGGAHGPDRAGARPLEPESCRQSERPRSSGASP